MAKKKESITQTISKRPPATTPEARENQMIAKAIALAEKQLDDGTASSQVITHFLKLGSTKEKAELENLREQNKLIKAKTGAIESAKGMEELFNKAIAAMVTYSGQSGGETLD